MNKLFFTFFLGLLLVGSVSAASWYVDNAVATSGNGQSWSTAWKAFSNIAWSSVQPGDIIYISGGTTSKTYYETLNVGKSGTEGNLITVTNGLESGHDGQVIINTNFAGPGINIVDIHDFKISDLTIKNNNYGIKIDGNKAGGVNNIYIESSKIISNSNRGIEFNGWGLNGLARNYVTNIHIMNNIITTPDYSETQTDAIYGQYFTNVFIVGNTLSQINQRTPSSHCDGIQLYAYLGATIGDNFITGTMPGGEPDQAIILEALEEQTTYIYNNILYTTTWNHWANTLLIKVNVPNTGKYYIYGNTLIGGDTLNLLNFNPKTNAVTDAYVKNNIFYSSATVSAIQYSQSIAASHIDNNLYYYTTGNTNIANYNGYKTLSQMRSVGAETGGVSGNPNFLNFENNLHLQIDSPAIDAGVTLETPYNFDRDGVYRPQGTAWDIGAYEYVGGTVSCVSVSPADNSPCDGCISLGEISEYVNLWLSNQGVTLENVSGAVNLWIGGC